MSLLPRKWNWSGPIVAALLMNCAIGYADDLPLPSADSAPAALFSRRESLVHEAREIDTTADSLDAISTESQSDDGGFTPTDLITELYGDGSIKIQYYLAQDDVGNFVLQGDWLQRNEAGEVIANGKHNNNQKHGRWNRWFKGDESKVLESAKHVGFQAPFISQAVFKHGKLHGKWKLYDHNKLKVFEIAFSEGRRNGNAVWYFPNGQRLLDVMYENDVIDGDLYQWNPKNKSLESASYNAGRRITPKIKYYENGKVQMKTMFLYPKVVLQTPDDWWNAKLAVYKTQGVEELHGLWTSYYPSGKIQSEGEHRHNQRVGMYIRHYENGVVAIQGEYKDGKQHGHWIWRHKNGKKAVQGEYNNGAQVSTWLRWDENGVIAGNNDYRPYQSQTILRSQQGKDDPDKISIEDKIRVSDILPLHPEFKR